jgi:hypothetical protein
MKADSNQQSEFDVQQSPWPAGSNSGRLFFFRQFERHLDEGPSTAASSRATDASSVIHHRTDRHLWHPRTFGTLALLAPLGTFYL